MSLNFLVGPLVGAVIGGITNSIAIKMLFRPLNPIKIGSYTLPFTPGVIPKEKVRIAHKVGQVVSEELLNEEVLRQWLLKEEVYKQIEESIDRYLQEYAESDKSLQDVLDETVGKERSMYYTCEIEEQLTERLYGKIVSMELGKVIIEKIQDAYKAGSFGNLLGPMSFFINDSLIETVANKIEPIISQFIEEEGEEIIRKAVEEESNTVLNTSMKDWTYKLQRYDELIKKNIIKAYEKIVMKHLTQILHTLDIAQIVEQRILELDMEEIERIILSIMQKELNAIVWFGVLLGAIMGCITSFV
ncbi:MAG: DUF445 family protein [Cellulosilyticum sp.]|nr:DUF445 family protein [Cellulosilyticum sp.]MEE1072104.1 DUF445 family protein [Cellulosilyticum sp.]